MPFCSTPSFCILCQSLTKSWLVLVSIFIVVLSTPALAKSPDRQPFEATVQHTIDAMQIAGSPLPEALVAEVERLRQSVDDDQVVDRLIELLDAYCLIEVGINPESRVKVQRGKSQASLIEQGWTNILVKVVNEAGVTAPLACSSPQAAPMVKRDSGSPDPKISISPAESNRRWLDIAAYDSQPLPNKLTGLEVEYRLFQLYARDEGKREATIAFNVGQGTQDLGFRSEIAILFDCVPSATIPLAIHDFDGKPTTCSLLIKDRFGRVYPNPSRRLAPDFFFHEQIYRAHGETVDLPIGDYTIVATRGPEYLPQTLSYSVSDPQQPPELVIELRRWINMAEHGWFSGDHHVHAAGCSHYENPTQGVSPNDMMRHIIGEDLNVGCVLSWGPCWYHQKQFFDGQVSKLSQPGSLMRYDVEVSGFPSSHAGHLCLLNLQEDDYPGTTTIEQWPSWTLPVLQWGKSQGGIVGYSHSGWGLSLPDFRPDGSRGSMPGLWGGAGPEAGNRAADKLPDYAMPPFDGIGANEFIVTVAHDACDFISAVDTPSVWELNIWYHTLNCGFDTRISGETDFPCIYGEKVGLGRSYVHVPDIKSAEELTYSAWVSGLADGRSYVTDGLSHLIDLRAEGRSVGELDDNLRASVVSIPAAQAMRVQCKVAAYLPKEADALGEAIRTRRLDEKPYWHLERARKPNTRGVPVELVMNGEVVSTEWINADGELHELEFEVAVQQSSWLAVRILPSMHSNPIFVEVDGKPIRTSSRSAQWCRDAVDVCWSQKRTSIRADEIDAAKAAYDKARDVYEQIASECADSQ